MHGLSLRKADVWKSCWREFKPCHATYPINIYSKNIYGKIIELTSSQVAGHKLPSKAAFVIDKLQQRGIEDVGNLRAGQKHQCVNSSMLNLQQPYINVINCCLKDQNKKTVFVYQ